METVHKEIKAQSEKEKGLHRKQMETKDQNHEQQLLHWYIFIRRIRQIYNVVHTRLPLDSYYRRGA